MFIIVAAQPVLPCLICYCLAFNVSWFVLACFWLMPAVVHILKVSVPYTVTFLIANRYVSCLTDSVPQFLKTAKIQVLKKAGRPSERLVSHDDCRSRSIAQHLCVHVKEITEAAGTEDAEAEAEYDAALKEAIQGVQEAVTNINEHMEEVRYEIEALDAETVGSNWTEVEEAFPGTLSIK
jgi:hypothetical protein